jgi:hypothetical protein
MCKSSTLGILCLEFEFHILLKICNKLAQFRRRLPSNAPASVQVTHRISAFFEVNQDLGKKLATSPLAPLSPKAGIAARPLDAFARDLVHSDFFVRGHLFLQGGPVTQSQNGLQIVEIRLVYTGEDSICRSRGCQEARQKGLSLVIDLLGKAERDSVSAKIFCAPEISNSPEARPVALTLGRDRGNAIHRLVQADIELFLYPSKSGNQSL